LEYHERHPAGKIFTGLGKPVETQSDLSIAYSPGVAEPCRLIHKDENLSFRYTGRGNLVGVITNGTAVLGLGDIGPAAAKPVMEGKAMLFKKYADIDVFDLELACKDPDEFIAAVRALEPTLGGINLEDIKAPECFYIEEKLRETMKIPVFHDDQHGTAIIAGAAFLNALEVTGKKLKEVNVVFSGSGAAAIATANLFLSLGVNPDNVLMCDSKGVLSADRSDLNAYKKKFARKTSAKTLEDALRGCDVFVGVSVANVLKPEMIQPMAKNPIIFALANPDPEIHPDAARLARPDAIIATGRSDFPNQVNNVLGFPFIFRGALDVQATVINEEMKLAAVRAIAKLAKEDVPEAVIKAYDGKMYRFGRDYLIPKPMDPRVLFHVAPAVAEAAMKTGVARRKVDLQDYHKQIERVLGPARQIVKSVQRRVKAFEQNYQKAPRIVIPHAADRRTLRAIAQVVEEATVRICVLGSKERIRQDCEKQGLRDFTSQVDVIDPLREEERAKKFAERLFEIRQRKGVSRVTAEQMVRNHNYFAALMLDAGDADGIVSGVVEPYSTSVKPILEVIGTEEDKALAGVYMVVSKGQLYFFADCTINICPSAEDLAKIAIQTAQMAKLYTDEKVRVAMLSFSSFGSSKDADPERVRRATEIVKNAGVGVDVEGEMQVDVALNEKLREDAFPFLQWDTNANVLIFPDLNSSNIAYKLLTNISDARSIGPVLLGAKKPANVLQVNTSTDEIVNMIYVTANQIVESRKMQRPGTLARAGT
jgi:malate dehydrogenase (oxaloacetate-decarboxylating)(NADP+)